ncbi:uncharacterized protein V6R79_000496 [Siganus canaliculatus]
MEQSNTMETNPCDTTQIPVGLRSLYAGKPKSASETEVRPSLNGEKSALTKKKKNRLVSEKKKKKYRYIATEKKRNSISSEQLWLSGNTKDAAFFALDHSSVSYTVLELKRQSAKDGYKPLKELERFDVLVQVLFCFIQLIDGERCGFWLDAVTSTNSMY